MEKEAWKEAIMENLEKGWYKRALRLMAANCGDKGDVAAMIDGFIENADPADNWREALE